MTFWTRRRLAINDNSSGAIKEIIRIFNVRGMGNFCQHRIVFLPVHKLAIQSYIQSLIIFCHDAVLSLYLAKL